MRKRLATVAVIAAAGAAALIAAATVTSVSGAWLLDAYVLLIGAALLAVLVDTTRAAGDSLERSLFERALRRPRRKPARPRELARLEREIVLGSENAFDLHARVRPLLREIAAHRLESARGLDLDRGSDETRALLGEQVWELVRPDRTPPRDRHAPGLPLARLDEAVARLERL